MRVRSLVTLLSTEIFGIAMALPEFPVMKGLRGMGMSDSPPLASRLAEKFDYTNTFYHQAPLFDVTEPGPSDMGRYDFVLSSEVLEHVPAPVERAFQALGSVLRPEGVLLMTTPYRLGGETAEHFPDLHEYTLASPGGRTVLVNRRRDGRVEVFEDLMFHGGHGSTLEMRVFSEDALRRLLAGAGFLSVRIAAENFPEFGVEHAETWSLPIAARKVPPAPPPAELARQYREASARVADRERELAKLSGDYQRYVAFHHQSREEMQRDLEARAEWGQKLEMDLEGVKRELEDSAERGRKLEVDLEERTKWARGIEADLEERTKWALDLEREKNEALASYEQTRKAELEAWECVKALEKELDATRAKRAQLEARLWTRLGRRLRVMS